MTVPKIAKSVPLHMRTPCSQQDRCLDGTLAATIFMADFTGVSKDFRQST